MKGVIDNRKYEQKQADEGSPIYEEAISTEWGYRYNYLTVYSWGKEFNEPFLDFGCGTGLTSKAIEDLGRQVTAFDISRGMLSYAKKRCSIPLVLADGLNLPFRDKVFSTTFVIGVMHHIMDLEKAFGEINRCTKEVVCINEPSPRPSVVMRLILFMIYVLSSVKRIVVQVGAEIPPLKVRSYHSKFERPIDPEILVELCRANKLKVVRLRYYNHIPFLHEFLSENVRRWLFSNLISLKNGTDVEIIAKRVN
jgi:ubiquinone/menaquinone biosynthesis C-methylase UbiE